MNIDAEIHKEIIRSLWPYRDQPGIGWKIRQAIWDERQRRLRQAIILGNQLRAIIYFP